jgi:hypothetical protein
MIYPFQCPACGAYKEVIRTVDECGLPLVCDCGQPMTRVYSVPQVNVPFGSSYYDLGLGATIRNKADQKDAIKRIKDKTGMSVVECGNENVSKHCKPQYKPYDVPRGIFDNAITED